MSVRFSGVPAAAAAVAGVMGSDAVGRKRKREESQTETLLAQEVLHTAAATGQLPYGAAAASHSAQYPTTMHASFTAGVMTRAPQADVFAAQPLQRMTPSLGALHAAMEKMGALAPTISAAGAGQQARQAEAFASQPLRRTESSLAALHAARKAGSLVSTGSAAGAGQQARQAEAFASQPLRRTESSLAALHAAKKTGALTSVGSAAGAGREGTQANVFTAQSLLQATSFLDDVRVAIQWAQRVEAIGAQPLRLAGASLGLATPVSAAAAAGEGAMQRIPSRVLMPPPPSRQKVPFPRAVSLLFLSYLDPLTLETLCHIEAWEPLADEQELWNAFNTTTLFPKLRIFDEIWWETHVDLAAHQLTVEEFFPLNPRLDFPAMQRLYEAIEGDAGMTILTVPQGLTFKKLKELGIAAKWGQSDEVVDAWENPTPTSYRVLLSNALVANSRNLSFERQKALVEGVGCQAPRALEMALLIAMTQISHFQYIYTRCENEPHSPAELHLLVTGLKSEGISVVRDQNRGAVAHSGMGARKLIA